MRSLVSEARTVAGEGPSEARSAVGDMGEGLPTRRSVGVGTLCSADGLVGFEHESTRPSIHSPFAPARIRESIRNLWEVVRLPLLGGRIA